MDLTTLAIGALVALGVLLIFAGLVGGPSPGARLEGYVSAPEADGGDPRNRANLADMISSSGPFTNFNRVVEARDWGANLARELARADLALKPSEFLAIRGAAVVGVPLAMYVLSPVIQAFNNPLLWIIGVVVGFWGPRFWLNRRKGKRLKAFNTNL